MPAHCSVGGAGCNERCDRTSFGDAFFEDLAVFRFLVIEQGVNVHWLVFLADAGINTDGAEKGFHAEGAGFIWNDGDDQLSDFVIL